MTTNKMVDFHSHILPGVDDGSNSLQESLAMLRMEYEQGIDCVVATPHFYADRDTPERFLRRRGEAEQMLREALRLHQDCPRVKVGAEVRYFSAMSQSDCLAELSIDGKKHILVEMPFVAWTDKMYEEICQIYLRQGLVPIIAHVERYINRFTAHKVCEKLADTPALIQANAEFFLNKGTAAMALRMLKRDQIHLLGSDSHNLTTRKPNLGDACRLICERLGEDAFHRIADHAAWLF